MRTALLHFHQKFSSKSIKCSSSPSKAGQPFSEEFSLNSCFLAVPLTRSSFFPVDNTILSSRTCCLKRNFLEKIQAWTNSDRPLPLTNITYISKTVKRIIVESHLITCSRAALLAVPKRLFRRETPYPVALSPTCLTSWHEWFSKFWIYKRLRWTKWVLVIQGGPIKTIR